jgi:hypothetical protein
VAPMSDHTTAPGERSQLGREEALWAEIIRCEVGSWRPARLPARFRPGVRRQHSPLWAGLPLAIAATLMVLSVVTLANLSGDVTVVLSNLAGIRLPAPPGSDGGASPAGRHSHGQPPATGAGQAASSARTSGSATGPSPHIAQVGTASEPRTTASSPSAGGLAPLPSPPSVPTPLPSAPNVPPLSTPAIPVDPTGGLSAGQPPGGGLIAVPSPG